MFQSRNQSCVHNRVYNNVFYECGYYAIKVNQKQTTITVDNLFVNNIMYRSKMGGDYEQYWEAGNYTIGFETYHAEAGYKWGDEKFAEGHVYFESNIILNADRTTDKPGDVSVFWLEVAQHRWTLDEVQTAYPKVFAKNYEFNPRFVDSENGNFNLRPDSQAIDAGSHLTKTTEAGSSTTTILVEDPYYFIDGYGLIDGDMIQVGSNSPVMVTNVDFDSKTLTVATPISFDSGATVSLAYSGSAPDLGAFEYYVAPTPSAGSTPAGPAGNSPSGSNSPNGQSVPVKVSGASSVAPMALVALVALLAF